MAALQLSKCVLCVVLCVSLRTFSVSADFVLSFGNPTPPVPTTPRPTLPGGIDPACKDKIANCANYGSDSCTGQYTTWARRNCEATCGFCKPPPTAPPPCVDKLADCSTYEQSACSDPKFRPWAISNCRAYCRECTASQLAAIDAAKTTLPPSQCVDKVECSLYGKDACNPAVYGKWGEENCALYCGFCTGVPTPPAPCMDINNNCAGYQSDICTNPDYSQWIDKNCRKFCGVC